MIGRGQSGRPRLSLLAGVAFAAAILLFVGAARPLPRARADELGGDTIIVRYDWGATVQAQSLGETPPTLEEQGYRSVRVPPGKTPAQFIAELKSDPRVLSAEEDAPVYAASIPNDPLYASNQSAYLERIGMPQAWDTTTGSNTIVVAVLDSGTDLAHPEFAGRLWENPRDVGADGIDADGNKCVNDRYGCRFLNLTPERREGCGYTTETPNGDVRDDHGKPGSLQHSHGTLVAGIIGAAGNNNVGTTGVAWDVRIMTVKVLDCGVGGAKPEGELSNVALGIEYATRMGANIINLSLAADSDREVLRSAIATAQAQGVIIVAAAGNHTAGSSQVAPGYPAAYTQFPNVVAVGASDNTGNWAATSNYGSAIDFAAPGTDIAGPSRTNLGLTLPYVFSDGTSMATPLVSGMFALMMSRNSRLTAADYIQIARDSAAPAPPAPHGQPWAGAGIINVGAAVARVPLTVTGSPLRDWRDVPAGAVIRALIGGNECGSATSTRFGLPVALYQLRIKSDIEQPGCGFPGRQIAFTIDNVPATPGLVWPGRNENLGLSPRDLTTISPPPGPIVDQALNGAWANVVHLDAAGPLPDALKAFPSGWSSILRWDPFKDFLDLPGAFRRFHRDAPAYVNDLTSLEMYDAIWVYGGTGNAASGNPEPPPGRAIQLGRGWNNITWTGSAASVADALASINGRYSQVLQYDNTDQVWRSYLPGQPRYLNDFGGLFKLKTYWIYVTAPATLTMP